MAEREEEEQTIAQDVVVTKYKMVAEIVNRVIKEVADKCISGAKVLDLCVFGDEKLSDGTSKIYRKDKEVKKGIAFPTSISVNNCVCHYSPLKTESDAVLKDGDLVKIDLGAHLDGFIAVVAHSLVVGASASNKVTGRNADAILAAHHAAEAALRLLKGGNENYLVTDTIQKVVEEFSCKPVEGMLSHQLQQHRIDGEKAIILNPSDAQRKDHPKCEFDVHEVYAVDILVSSGEGKAKERDTRTTIYKRKPDLIYQLKMKASRAFLSEAENNFNTMPFTLRAFADESKAKMGVVECVKHTVVEPFPVLFEKEGEVVAQLKFTVLMMPNGPMKITGLPMDLSLFESEHKIEDEELKTLLAQPISSKSNRRKNKKKSGEAQAEVAAAAAES
ncbi:proliferation-associated protein 2G4-like [Watersipora subatra]|uniref:proliferation-associated protein 2G4-like n=1 Tax=Watersipora subatra TaxID=2589382 RepID=UPI00355B5E8D